ncbi:MAG: metal-dependent hydrolase, partial [Acidobacteriota bacterium]
ADAGLAKKTPLATATLLVGVNLPDVDAFTYFVTSADTALYLRRGWTHGVLAMVVLPTVLAGLVALFERAWRQRRDPQAEPIHFAWILGLAYLGFLTHPFLDWLNTYGIRLLMPFDGRWFYGDTLFIVDPWLWLTLGGAAFLYHSQTWRSRIAWGALGLAAAALLLSNTAGQPLARLLWFAGLAGVLFLRWRTTRPTSAWLARGALVCMALYIGVLHAGSAQAHRDVEARLPDLGITASDVMIGPVPVRPLRHVVVIDTAREYRFGTYDWLAEPRLEILAQTLPKPSEEPAVQAAFGAHCLRGMANWTRYPWVEIEEDENGTIVHVMDARYTRSRTAGFGGSSVRIGRDLRPDCAEE